MKYQKNISEIRESVFGGFLDEVETAYFGQKRVDVIPECGSG